MVDLLGCDSVGWRQGLHKVRQNIQERPSQRKGEWGPARRSHAHIEDGNVSVAHRIHYERGRATDRLRHMR